MQRVKTLIKKYPGMLSMLGMCFYDYCILPCNAIIWGIAMIVIPVMVCKECIDRDALLDEPTTCTIKEKYDTLFFNNIHIAVSIVLSSYYCLRRINDIVWISFSASSVIIVVIAGVYTYEIYKKYIHKWTSDNLLRVICCAFIVYMASVGIVYLTWSISHPTHMEANVIQIVDDKYERYGPKSSITLKLDNGKTEKYRGNANMGKKIRAGVQLVRCEHQCAFGVHIRDIHFYKGENCRCSDCHQDE